jgi:hypothetical protein
VGARSGMNALENRKILPLEGIEPQLFSPKHIAIPIKPQNIIYSQIVKK